MFGTPQGQGPATDNVKVIIAREYEHMHAVCDLVNRCYSARGYKSNIHPGTPFPDAERAAYYMALLAIKNGKAVGTVTLGIDSSHGLLVDEVNGKEVHAVRRQGRGVGELVRLAIDDPASSKEVWIALFEQLYVMIRRLGGLTDMFVEVNPRHAPFYRRLFGFSVVADSRTCPRVGAPSVLMRMTREQLEGKLYGSGPFDLGVWHTGNRTRAQAAA